MLYQAVTTTGSLLLQLPLQAADSSFNLEVQETVAHKHSSAVPAVKVLLVQGLQSYSRDRVTQYYLDGIHLVCCIDRLWGVINPLLGSICRLSANMNSYQGDAMIARLSLSSTGLTDTVPV